MAKTMKIAFFGVAILAAEDSDAMHFDTTDLNAGKFITVQSKPGPSIQSGLVGSHAYAVLEVVGNSVKLYNPWGKNPGGKAGEILVPWELLVMDTDAFWVR